ncbi:hypothetical protein [Bacillus chungangensis]|uniref:Uncharacterized protein n=1 Tax=Bacillus chungangensis TaxID=587633 RepID=A0ABT9WSD3_9BACI|nr:hypothetical protein [Bacillus chungangensis]MDQ0176029.1 hypothetical protein [Bacillus chungangensis]
MSQLTEQFNYQQSQPQGNVLAQSTSSREMEEVKGAIFMARQFPRNVFQAEQRILDSCKRISLAETAVYQYKRGSAKISGPSIRLAEVVAQNWGNIDSGIKELEQREGESDVMAYAWDLETNTRQTKVFTVKHSMKAKGSIKKLTDPRDIYEKVANDGARRLRSCILSVIPGDIVEKAIQQCEETLRGNSNGPLKDRISNALNIFKGEYRVTQEMVEERFGYNAESFSEYDYVELIKIYNSLKDGMSKVDDWFNKDAKKKSSSGLADAFNEEKKTGDKEEVRADDTNQADPQQSELPFD